MGTGSGPGGLNSRIFTNSFAGQSSAMAYPYRNLGNSFGGLSKPQYSYLTFFSLVDCGGVGARFGRFRRARHIPPIKFIPPKIK